MTRLTHWIAAACVALSGAAAHAQDNPVVVELFTSQGCSSCPAADAVLAELGSMDDVIPLALHVDYWDYIGWTDAFADPAFTKRQKGYARAAGRRSIYTPQMMIGGVHDVVGSRSMKVVDAIRKVADKPARARLTLTREGAVLEIHAEALGRLPVTLVQLVRYTPQARVQIDEGENAGHVFNYTHIAHGWQVLGRWDGVEPLEMEVPVEGDDPVVVMVQEEGYGPILAAARLR